LFRDGRYVGQYLGALCSADAEYAQPAGVRERLDGQDRDYRCGYVARDQIRRRLACASRVWDILGLDVGGVYEPRTDEMRAGAQAAATKIKRTPN